VFFGDDTAINTIRLEDYGENVPSSAITLSNANGALLSKVVKTNNQMHIINKVIIAHAGGSYASTNTSPDYDSSASNTTYGTRGINIYRPEVREIADARLTANAYKYYFDDPENVIIVDVNHSYLHANSTHYPVLNTVYTITDSINNVSYANVTVNEHTLRWPSFKDTIKLGGLLPDAIDSAVDSNTSNIRSGQDSAGLNVAFKAYNNSASNDISNTGSAILVYAVEDFDIGSNFDTSTYKFKAPLAGIYHFSACENPQESLDTGGAYVNLVIVNETSSTNLAIVIQENVGSSTQYISLHTSCTAKLAKDDLVKVVSNTSNSSPISRTAAAAYAYFCGHLIAPI
jgi:hypothetical protein